jgi:hypothetical protein
LDIEIGIANAFELIRTDVLCVKEDGAVHGREFEFEEIDFDSDFDFDFDRDSEHLFVCSQYSLKGGRYA